MNTPEEEIVLQLHPRSTESVLLQIPADALLALEKVADSRDMSVQALLKLYVGQGLRQDAARLFSERVMETTAQALARHIPSEEVRSAILREIQGEVAA